MRRRSFVVGTACGLAAATAGCLGSGQESLSERPPENEVEDAIRTAIGEANTAAVEVALVADDGVDPTSVELDWEALRGRLETAHAALDDAESHAAADDYQADVEAARTYVQVVHDLLGAASDLVDLGGRLDTLEEAVAEEDYDRASEELDAIRPDVEAVASTTADAIDAAQSVDAERLAPYGAKTARVGDGLGTLDDVATAADHLTAGYDDVLAGREHMERGRDEFSSRNFEAAASEFETAGDRFASATTSFETGQSETDELGGEFETALCRSGHLEAAATHFANAADAADGGDVVTARDEREQGEEELNAAANC